MPRFDDGGDECVGIGDNTDLLEIVDLEEEQPLRRVSEYTRRLVDPPAMTLAVQPACDLVVVTAAY